MSSLRANSDRRLPRSTKVYKLIGSQWADQGTAFCYGQFENETNQAFLIARSEVHFDKLILTTRIRTTDVYQRQQGPFCIRIYKDLLIPTHATTRYIDCLDGTGRCRLRLELPGRRRVCRGVEFHH
jgi:hypothetical protein